MTLLFVNNYSDMIGSFRRGWQRDVPDSLARQLIASGTAVAVESPQADPVEPAKPAAKRKPKTAKPVTPEQYVTQAPDQV